MFSKKKPTWFMKSDWGWGSMWFGFPLLGKNRATIWAVTCEHHPDKKSYADTSLAIGHMPGCLPQHTARWCISPGSCRPLPTGPCSGWATFAGAIIFALSATKRLFLLKMTQPWLKGWFSSWCNSLLCSRFSGHWWVSSAPSTLVSICAFLLIKSLRR